MELTELLSKCDQGFFEVEFTSDFCTSSGFFVKMRPIDRELEVEFGRKCKKVIFDPKTHQRLEEFDDEKFANLADDKLIIGWRGLTPKLVSMLIPSVKVDESIPADTEIPCNAEAKRALMAKSKDFAKFVMATVVDACKIKADLLETEEKNSLTSHAGISAEGASRAKSAKPHGA